MIFKIEVCKRILKLPILIENWPTLFPNETSFENLHWVIVNWFYILEHYLVSGILSLRIILTFPNPLLDLSLTFPVTKDLIMVNFTIP